MRATQIILLIVFLVSWSTTQAAPPQAPPVDERLTGIETRLDTVESRVDALEGKTSTACPCPAGPCICKPGECDCKDCPTHKPALRLAYEAEVEALTQLRESLIDQGKDEETIARQLHATRREIGVKYKDLTPLQTRSAIYERNYNLYGDKLGPSIDWLRGKGKTWNEIAESASDPGDWPPKGMTVGNGRRVLFFTADWCVPCQQAKARLGTLIEQCEVIDCTEGNPCPEYRVTAYPTALLVVDGETQKRCVGEHIGPLILGGWLAAQADVSRPVPGAISIPVSRPAVSVSSLFYSPGRSSWTWPGDLRQHMASEHGYTLSSLNSMSDQSVISLHEQLHSGNRQPARRAQTVRYAQPTYQPRTYFRQQSYCPSCAR
jgi:hypothetical protein